MTRAEAVLRIRTRGVIPVVRAPAAADARQKVLRHHGGQCDGQFLPDRRLAFHRKRICHAGNSGRDISRMQSGKDQVSCFSRGQRHPHGLWIAHLADNDDIRRLPHRRPECRRKIRCVDSDLDLLDDALLLGVLVFDGIFNRDDVLCIPAVDFINECSERCRLT